MARVVPAFPLNTVVFPGTALPLHVFEERYRALVEHLLELPDPAERVFATVAIRDGYEVGEHGAQSLYRVGCLLQLTDVESNPDGSFEVEAVARERIRVEEMVGGNDFPSVRIVDVPDGTDPTSEEALLRARGTFTAYRAAVAQMQGDPFTGTLPQDPEFLSWTLATAVPLPLAEKQELLEAEDPAVRLAMVTDFLREELRAINVIPSMPAVQVARTSWSPN